MMGQGKLNMHII